MSAHTCQPEKSQMTDIYPINNALELTGNGRRVYTTQTLTAVAHLVIALVSPTLYVTHRNKQEACSEYVIADS